MATVYSAQRTNSRATPVVKNKANELGGRVRIAHGTYEAASLASGDVVEMFVLPDNARLISGFLANDALGASTTLSVGDGAHNNAAGTVVALSAAAYLAATSTSSAAKTAVVATLALGSGSEIDANANGQPVTVTLGGASATGTIELTIMYSVD
jgi:uncharacterized membrane protein